MSCRLIAEFLFCFFFAFFSFFSSSSKRNHKFSFILILIIIKNSQKKNESLIKWKALREAVKENFYCEKRLCVFLIILNLFPFLMKICVCVFFLLCCEPPLPPNTKRILQICIHFLGLFKEFLINQLILPYQSYFNFLKS